MKFEYEDEKGTIASPGWSGRNGTYPPNQHCETVIELNPRYAIKFQMVAFELENGPPDCQFDYFSMYFMPPGKKGTLGYTFIFLP